MPSRERLRILLMSSEATPYAKTGGLADVAGALPRALAALGHDVRLLMPKYRGVEARAGALTLAAGGIRVPLGDRVVEGGLFEGRTPDGVTVYFLAHDHYYDREALYGTADGDYWDNCERFIFFCRGALEAVAALGAGGWRPQVIHANDWQTGLVPVYLRTLYREHPVLRSVGTLFTIHNLAYQGVFWHYDMPMTGLGWDLFTPAGIEFYGRLNFLKGGLVFSDLLTTVSRTYAHEIRTAAFGAGLEGVLEERSHDLHGVVNGIDFEAWNPETDAAIAKRFGPGDLEGKAICRRALEDEMGLTPGRGPIIGMVTRLASQKGLDLTLEALPGLLAAGARLVLLGSGEAPLEEAFTDAARVHRGRVAVRIGYSDEIARRIFAGADCFLMPSRYEPCGLSQLIALRYGTVPVVRRTGGLADTVRDAATDRRAGTGFLFDAFAVDALVEAVGRAVAAHADRARWAVIVRNGMAEDFSWGASAREYSSLYRKIIKARTSRERGSQP
jgi:starch synthase